MELIYQTIGYKKDNQDPTTQDIETATRNALSVPMTERYHFRIWFPERQGLVQKYWQWCREHTHYTMSLPLMKNCGHVAVFGFMPATDKAAKAQKNYLIYPRECFIKDGRINWFGDWWQGKRMDLIREFYLIMGSSIYEYARTMKQLGYFTGFGSVIHGYLQSFHDTFKDAFDGEPFIPLCMVHAGTKAALVTHTTTRQNLGQTDISGALVEVEDKTIDKTQIDADKKFKNVPYYTTDDDGKLVSITDEQALEMGAYGSNTIGVS